MARGKANGPQKSFPIEFNDGRLQFGILRVASRILNHNYELDTVSLGLGKCCGSKPLALALRRLFLCENLRVKEGGKEKTGGTSGRFFSFLWSLALRHQSLVFRARLCGKNKAPEVAEEADSRMLPSKLLVSKVICRKRMVGL